MAVATEKRRLLWVCTRAMPPNVSAAIGGEWEVVPCPFTDAISHRLRDADLALIWPPESEPLDFRRLTRVLDAVDRSGAIAVVLLPPELLENNLLRQRRGQHILARGDASPLELGARIDAAAALQPAIRHLQTDVASVRGFGGTAAGNFEELDEEMRLAARLQRDFLPQSLPEVGPVRFASLFQPVSWLSGDIYDVFRLDENHIGLYVADVVGHGMPAALLTMFIKKSLQTKRILGNSYEIVPPNITLALLNDDICQQGLTSCQFCTAVYAVINARTLLLRYACGGHPAAILLGANRQPRRLEAAGALLGVFPGETFQGCQVTLQPGDRLVLYSDGAEETITGSYSQDGTALADELQRLSHLDPDEMMFHLNARIEERRAAHRLGDDITVLAMDLKP